MIGIALAMAFGQHCKVGITGGDTGTAVDQVVETPAPSSVKDALGKAKEHISMAHREYSILDTIVNLRLGHSQHVECTEDLIS